MRKENGFREFLHYSHCLYYRRVVLFVFAFASVVLFACFAVRIPVKTGVQKFSKTRFFILHSYSPPFWTVPSLWVGKCSLSQDRPSNNRCGNSKAPGTKAPALFHFPTFHLKPVRMSAKATILRLLHRRGRHQLFVSLFLQVLLR
jgi:hypothetical protein